MSIGSEFLRVLINIAIVIIGGAVLYEIVVWTFRNIINPLIYLNKQIDKIPAFLTTYSQTYSNSKTVGKQRLVSISNETKIIAGKIITTRESIPLYGLWCAFGLVPERQQTDEIIRNLSFLAGAIFETDPSASFIEKIQSSIRSLEISLNIQKTSKQSTSEKPVEEKVPVV